MISQEEGNQNLVDEFTPAPMISSTADVSAAGL